MPAPARSSAEEARPTTGWNVSCAVVPMISFSSVGAADAGHLDQDAVAALPLDRRLARADLVDAAADDLERLAHGALVRRALLGLGQAHDDARHRAS